MNDIPLSRQYMSGQPFVSVILSFRNESEVLPELIHRLQNTFRPLPVRYELIFINDASTDNSLEIILNARKTDPAIKILNMSRRWGVTECTLAGIANSSGDAVVFMDADLQDPPELIPDLITKWQLGADVVNTVRRSRIGESGVKMLITRGAYKIIRMVSSIDLPVDAGDFKLLSRRAAVQVIKLQHESGPYLRGLTRWIGFNQVEVAYDRQPRAAGKTHFSLLKSLNPIKTFISGVISFSVIPLHAITVIGMALLIIAAGGWIFIFLAALLGSLAPHCLQDKATFLHFTVGSAQIFCLGIIGIYLGKLYHIGLKRPNYIIASRIGFDDTNQQPD